MREFRSPATYDPANHRVGLWRRDNEREFRLHIAVAGITVCSRYITRVGAVGRQLADGWLAPPEAEDSDEGDTIDP